MDKSEFDSIKIESSGRYPELLLMLRQLSPRGRIFVAKLLLNTAKSAALIGGQLTKDEIIDTEETADRHFHEQTDEDTLKAGHVPA